MYYQSKQNNCPLNFVRFEFEYLDFMFIYNFHFPLHTIWSLAMWVAFLVFILYDHAAGQDA